jgi:hypothetical protein
MKMKSIRECEFESFWNKWKLQKNNFKNKLEWWEQTKIKIKNLTIGVSKKLVHC